MKKLTDKVLKLRSGEKLKNIGDMKPGDSGIVKKVESFGALRRRIIDMGLTPGTKVSMVKCAPFGDPIEIKIHGYDLSIRKSEADKIALFENDAQADYLIKKRKLIKPVLKNRVAPLRTTDCDKDKIFKVALIGNPNSGKTTLFNSLTGSYQYVGNWPGVTVGRKEGRVKNIAKEVDLVDLPGVYSLSPYSPEEIVTRDYILNESPDLVINIIDATNLERNLYLTTQLLELDVRLIMAVNMTDLLEHKGHKIDYNALESELGIKIVPVSAGKNRGIDCLLKLISEELESKKNIRISKSIYSSEVENALDGIDQIMSCGNKYVSNTYFNNIKVFEDDPLLIYKSNFSPEKAEKVSEIRSRVSKLYEKDEDMIIADERYAYICELCEKVIKYTKRVKKLSFSNKLDKIVTGKYTAVPCFLLMILSVFYVTFGPIGSTLKMWCEEFINTNMYSTVERILNYLGASDWSKSLALDAVICGVGSVISFLPQVVLLFTLLSLLEDCGYMSRAAFIMDKPLRKIGLSGRAFVPLIMGFGCSVPAVLGTKILESKKDKNLTVFLIPFMSCSAKMPVYLLFASIFFAKYQTLVIFSLYVLGVAVAVLTAFMFKETLFKGEASPFIMEMPEYKIPSPKNVWMNVWDKSKDFIERAGTVILIATVVVWFLQSFDFSFHMVSDSSKSILAVLGNFMAPAFKICGFGDWRACVALLTGVMAKESIVSSLAVLYAGGSVASLGSVLPSVFSVQSAVSFLIFALLYTPCVAALSAINKEFESRKLMFISIVYQLFIAYTLSALTFQILTLFSNIKIF